MFILTYKIIIRNQKFIKKIVHGNLVYYIISWLGERVPQDCRVQKLINVIYHMIMWQGSNLQEFGVILGNCDDVDLPKFSVFMTYKPGITNLRSFNIHIELQNTVEFLSMVSNFYNGIVNCKLWIEVFRDAFLDFIKLQPLERLMIHIDNNLDK